MIEKLGRDRLGTAAEIRSLSWTAEYGPMCSEKFRALHTPQEQLRYFQAQMDEGAEFYMLSDPEPAGIVSLRGSSIENLYVLPHKQGRGYGTELLRFALRLCPGLPRLWVLEENRDAQRLYSRLGFVPTGRRGQIPDGLWEIEMAFKSDI